MVKVYNNNVKQVVIFNLQSYEINSNLPPREVNILADSGEMFFIPYVIEACPLALHGVNCPKIQRYIIHHPAALFCL